MVVVKPVIFEAGVHLPDGYALFLQPKECLVPRPVPCQVVVGGQEAEKGQEEERQEREQHVAFGQPGMRKQQQDGAGDDQQDVPVEKAGDGHGGQVEEVGQQQEARKTALPGLQFFPAADGNPRQYGGGKLADEVEGVQSPLRQAGGIGQAQGINVGEQFRPQAEIVQDVAAKGEDLSDVV